MTDSGSAFDAGYKAAKRYYGDRPENALNGVRDEVTRLRKRLDAETEHGRKVPFWLLDSITQIERRANQT